YIQSIVPSFDGAVGFSFNKDYFDDASATFNGSEGTFEGTITDTRSFWNDSSAGNYRKASIKLVAECKSSQLKLMEIKYTYSGFDIVLTAEYTW
ncbi:MAG: hypothetical protein K2I79_00405, partial [Clostridia bacterium]|nr:hypothetical protein [Clostridia bacterium]